MSEHVGNRNTAMQGSSFVHESMIWGVFRSYGSEHVENRNTDMLNAFTPACICCDTFS